MDLLAVQQALKSLLQHHSSKASILQCSFFFIVQLSHPYMTTGKTITLTRQTFVSKVSSLIFNMLPRFVTEKEMETHSSILVWKLPQMGEPGVLQSTGSQESDMTERLHSVLSVQVCHSFFPTPRSKHLLISWLQSQSAVILELKKIKSIAVSMVSPSICHEMVGPDAMALVF